MQWSEEAKKAMEEVPFFVRKRVRKRVEEEAVHAGAPEVRIDHVNACQKRFLTKMEDEVAGYQVETCFGPGGCPNRAIICDGLAEKIRNRFQTRDFKSVLKKIVDGPLKIHHEFRVSISDCPNACSRPQIADIGLIGACEPRVTDEICSRCNACAETCQEDAISFPGDGPFLDAAKCLNCGKCIAVCPTGSLQKGRSGYRVLLGGKLGRHPRLASELPGIFPAETLPRVIDACLDYYTSHCRNGERLGEILERRGVEEILKEISS